MDNTISVYFSEVVEPRVGGQEFKGLLQLPI
jgi:hypothetical protein